MSFITSIIGGIQGASAAHNAANLQRQGYQQAGQTVTNAVNQVNPNILAAGQAAGTGVTNSAAAAGTLAQQAAGTAGTNAAAQAAAAGLGATTAGAAAGTLAQQAAATGGQGATDAAGALNTMLSPYMQGGSAAMGQLATGMAPGGALSQPFTASMMSQYSPAYQFQLQQGNLAANRAAAAQGLTGSGGTMKALDRYNQDYAGTAFTNAANLYNTQQQAQFNRLSTLAGMGQQAATTGGTAGLQAAQFAGTLGAQGAQYAGTAGTQAAQYAGTAAQQAAQYGGALGTEAAQYAGTMGANAAQYAGNANINATNLTSSNTLSGANYLANTQIAAQNALAQGDINAAGQWNNMLGGIGQAINQVGAAELGALSGSGSFMGNLSNNMGNTASATPQLYGGGGWQGPPTAYSPPTSMAGPSFASPQVSAAQPYFSQYSPAGFLGQYANWGNPNAGFNFGT